MQAVSLLFSQRPHSHQSFPLCHALKSLMRKVHAIWLSFCHMLQQAAETLIFKFKRKTPKPSPALPTKPPILKKIMLAPAILADVPKILPEPPPLIPPQAPKDTPEAKKALFAPSPAPIAPAEPLAVKKGAFQHYCRQALKLAEKTKINSAEELEATYAVLNEQMLRVTNSETSSVLERYKTLACYLLFAAERAQRAQSAHQGGLRDKVGYLLEKLQQKYANRYLAIPAEHRALFVQIEGKIARRQGLDPQSLPLPGDEAPDENNLRSKRMRTWLDAMFTKQNYRDEKFYFANQEYELVTSEVSDFTSKRLASIGSSTSREIITLDPANCPKLSAYYQQLKQEVIHKSTEKGGLLTSEEMLQMVNDCVRNRIFPSCKQPAKGEKLEKFLADRRATKPSVPLAIGGSVPIFSIEDFIGGPAVCRHHGLVASYLLDRLVKSQGGITVPAGRVLHMRSDLDVGGAHVWVNFISRTGKYHLDTLWNVMRRFDQPAARRELDREYGPKAMRLQELRCAKAARLLAKMPASAAA